MKEEVAAARPRKPRQREVIAAKVAERLPKAQAGMKAVLPEGVTPLANGYFLLQQLRQVGRAVKRRTAGKRLRSR
jgi:hypothetical protein